MKAEHTTEKHIMLLNNEASTMGTTPAPEKNRKAVYTVCERGEKTWWTKIGVAFINRDGSITVRLDAVPVNGMLQVRDEFQDRKPAGGAQ